jgi:hypothetical protein
MPRTSSIELVHVGAFKVINIKKFRFSLLDGNGLFWEIDKPGCWGFGGGDG